MMKWHTLVLTAAAAVLTFAAVSCGKSGKDKDEASIEGCWELYNVATKSTMVGTVSVDVYVEFHEGAFTLYQRIGEGRYTRFDGSYKLGKKNELTGSYTGGKAWGPYTAEISESELVLSTDSEKDTYKKVASVPEKVLSNLY